MLRYLHCCYFCGKPVFRYSFVCGSCFCSPSLNIRNERGLKHQYLFEYDSYSEVFIKNLKYGKFSDVIKNLAFKFQLPADATVIAMPNSKNTTKEQNHAYVLARQIFLRQPIFEPFIKITAKQALNNKSSRQMVQLQLVESMDLRNTVILVDDLLTTGETIYKAWQLLGSPGNTIILTLSYTKKNQA